MGTLWEMGLANAAVAAILAPMAALATRVARRPAWAHALWVIVLLKLVTPPIAGVPIGVTWPASEAVAEAPADDVPAIAAGPIREDLPREAIADGPIAEARPARVATPGRAWWPPVSSWPRALGVAWLVGSAAWVVLAAWRIGRFARAMRRADEAPEALTAWVEDLSAQLGLARAPIVILSPGRLAPMVWALGGRARLVVPEALWKRLGQEQRAALLVHELAHLRRRDHWVRLLELLATGLYWWHPALWWARKGLHRAEEECCDLWVVWALPQAKRTYATALVEAVEFLSEDRPRALPVGASGMGQVEDLSRRIGMIMRGDTPRGLTRSGVLASLALALLLLPWRPTVARQEPAKPEEARPEEVTERVAKDIDVLILQKEVERAKLRLDWSRAMQKKGYLSPAQVKAEELALLRAQKRLGQGEPEQEEGDAADPKPKAKAKAARDDLDEMTQSYAEAYFTLTRRLKAAQAQAARMEKLAETNAVGQQPVDEAREKVQELQGRLELLEGRGRLEAEARERAAQDAMAEVAILKSQLKTRMASVAKIEAQAQLARAASAQVERLVTQGVVSRQEREKAEVELAIANAAIVEAKAEAEEVQVKLSQAMERAQRLRKQAAAPRPKTPPAADFTDKPAPSAADRRLDELESKLERVLKELEAMRKEQKARFDSKDGPAQ